MEPNEYQIRGIAQKIRKFESDLSSGSSGFYPKDYRAKLLTHGIDIKQVPNYWDEYIVIDEKKYLLAVLKYGN